MKIFILLPFFLLLPFLSFCQPILPGGPSLSPNGDCFSMSVTYPEPGSTTCITVTLDVGDNIGPGNSVYISDGMGNYVTCSSDCSFTWCYSEAVMTNAYIECGTTGPESILICNQIEGCVVVVGGS